MTEVYVPYYSRKWKASTRANNMNRVSIHLVEGFGNLALSSFRRDQLQDVLDEKATGGLSFSTVDHLRWDLKQIFDMAVAECLVVRNPALLLFTPKEAAKPLRRVMSIKEVQTCFSVLGQRERLIAKLAIMAGMRPGEIFAYMGPSHCNLCGHSATGLSGCHRYAEDRSVDPESRFVRRPPSRNRRLASVSHVTRDDAWVFPLERMTPMSKDNCWNRNIKPKLEKVGMGWANFLVMRRTHATLMNELGVNGKLVADQLGHSLDVSQNVYTQSPVKSRLPAVNQLEKTLLVM